MSCQRRVAALWRGSSASYALVKQRATVLIQCAERCRQRRKRRKVLFDAWYEGLLKLGDQMFEELADCRAPTPSACPTAPGRRRRACLLCRS